MPSEPKILSLWDALLAVRTEVVVSEAGWLMSNETMEKVRKALEGDHECAVRDDPCGTPVEWPERQPMRLAGEGTPSAQPGQSRPIAGMPGILTPGTAKFVARLIESADCVLTDDEEKDRQQLIVWTRRLAGE